VDRNSGTIRHQSGHGTARCWMKVEPVRRGDWNHRLTGPDTGKVTGRRKPVPNGTTGQAKAVSARSARWQQRQRKQTRDRRSPKIVRPRRHGHCDALSSVQRRGTGGAAHRDAHRIGPRSSRAEARCDRIVINHRAALESRQSPSSVNAGVRSRQAVGSGPKTFSFHLAVP